MNISSGLGKNKINLFFIMKSKGKVDVGNIVDGKRRRVMSSEAVLSIVAEEFTRNLLNDKLDQISQNRMEGSDYPIQSSKVGTKQIQKVNNIQQAQCALMRFSSSENLPVAKPNKKVAISKRVLLKLIDEYFYIVTSSESESESSPPHKQVKPHREDSKSQKKIKQPTPPIQTIKAAPIKISEPPVVKKIKSANTTDCMAEMQELSVVPDINQLLHQIQQ